MRQQYSSMVNCVLRKFPLKNTEGHQAEKQSIDNKKLVIQYRNLKLIEKYFLLFLIRESRNVLKTRTLLQNIIRYPSLRGLIEKFFKLGSRKNFLRNTKLDCEETHGNSLHESILLLITFNLNHCRALYSFSNKSYKESKTNFGENHPFQIVDPTVFAIVFQGLFILPSHNQGSLIG